MKKAFLNLIIIFYSVSLYSAEPIIKFYLQDGFTRQFKVFEIDHLCFKQVDRYYEMHIVDKIDQSVSFNHIYINETNHYDLMKSNFSFKMHIYHNKSEINSVFDIRLIDSLQFDTNNLCIYLNGNFVLEKSLTLIDSITFSWSSVQEKKIGYQTWMSKNLNVSHYRNGDSIPEVRDTKLWNKLKTGAWCYYDNDSSLNQVYGKLYNWYAVVDTRGLAPIGWHIPNDSEWTQLTNFVGGDSLAGKKLKESGSMHWISVNKWFATNEFAFSVIPGGSRGIDGDFYGLRRSGTFWSTTQFNSTNALTHHFTHFDFTLREPFKKSNGLSVRCIKDK